MSDDPSSPAPPPSPTGPSGKTQSVPLKKETVRITLRAKPGEAPASPEGAAPIAPPTAPLRPAVPAPMGRPPAPAPPSAPLGSRTIPLTSAPAPRTPTTPGRPTQPLAGGAAATQPMPKPTVRLQPQQAPGATATGAISSAPLKTAVLDDEEDEADDKGLGLIAGIVLGLAAILLLITAFSHDDFRLGVADDQANAGWKIPRKAIKPLDEDFARPITGGDGKITWKSALDLANDKKIQEFAGTK